jgi:guanylate kinase
MELTDTGRTDATTTPYLEHLGDFQSVLKNYRISAPAQRILDDTTFVLLVGPSSSGRNTIINKLLKTGSYHFIISDTTRPPRSNNGVLEQNGVQYWFRKETELLDDLKQGKFLEAEIIHGQQVSGISVRELEKAYNNHKIAITDIDIGGVFNVVRAKPDTAIILILPPNFDEWKRRLRERSAMREDEYRRRMQTALRIFQAPAQHDYFTFVINDNLEDAVRQVDAIAHGTIDPAQQARGAALIQELLAHFHAELDEDVQA